MPNAPELTPFRLTPSFSARPWGRRDLQPWYGTDETPASDEPIGEAWLTGPSAVAADGLCAGTTLADIAQQHAAALLGTWQGEREFPLLLKLLFPDDKLSVQVHPDDEGARRMGLARGKTECWYVVEAEPGATVACGLVEGTSSETLREAVQNGTMESLLQHVPVAAGDMVFVDAGTVHAIGPGVTLLETQQTSDTTFRMYDYGRPRELHLEQGIAATRFSTDAGKVQPRKMGGGIRLIEQRYFTVDRFALAAGESLTLADAIGRPHCLTVLEGSGALRSVDAETRLHKASATVVPACTGEVTLHAEEAMVVVRSMP